MLLYLFALLGILVHFIMKWRDSYTEKKPFNTRRQVILALFTIPQALLIVYFKDSYDTIIVLNNFAAFLIGYMVDSIWKNFINCKNKTLTQLKL